MSLRLASIRPAGNFRPSEGRQLAQYSEGR